MKTSLLKKDIKSKRKSGINKGLIPGEKIGRFRTAHVLSSRIRFTSSLLRSPFFDATYFQALLEAVPGVDSVRINTRGGSLIILYDGKEKTLKNFSAYLLSVPPEAYLSTPKTEFTARSSDVITKATALLISQLLPPPIRGLISFAISFDVLLEGVTTLVLRGIKVQVLDALAVGFSLVRAKYFTAGAISTLLCFGRYLEGQSEQRSVDLLKSLLRPPAEHIWLSRNGREVRVLAEEVVIGDTAIFGAGETIAIDGKVISGEALVNQSSISGESAPIHLKAGDTAISGSVVDEGRLMVLVEKTGSETSAARIGRFIDQSLRSKSGRQTKSSQLADRLVPVSLGLSFLVWLIGRDVNRAASVLTVDFSCALKLASPIAARSGMYAAGKSGVLLKGSAALDALIDVNTLVFDKTGTLTTGQMEVTDILPLEQISEENLLSLTAGAEEHYDHPVARAVVREATRRNLPLPPISRVDFIVAHGVSAFIDGKNVLVGGYHFIAEDEGIDCKKSEKKASRLRGEGKSLLYVAREGKLIGLIALRDSVREEAKYVLETLKQSGIKHIAVLTGDHKETALALKESLPQIDEVLYELKPEDKALVIENLKNKGHIVAFVGDGVNDTPALVSAHIGICMPGGADLAREAAQVLLLKEDLHTLLYALRVAHRTNTVIRRSFGATIFCNSLTVLMTALRGLPTAVAALLHNFSTVAILGYAGLCASKPLPLKEDKAALYVD